MRCKICQRPTEKEGFCHLHFEAYLNVVDKFSMWQAALGVSWTQYLIEIQKNSLTGIWAKDVSKHLIEEENKDV